MINTYFLQTFEILFKRKIKIILFLLLFGVPVFSQLPTAVEIAADMTLGWNIGNSLEVPGGETNWGNPKVSQELINTISNIGFNTIRIPCAWDSYANQTTLEIDSTWLKRVREVVDYCYANNMYIILNCHYDGGWLENNITTAMKDSVNKKQKAYWTQIANYFKDYDEHLMFAGANEPAVDKSSSMPILISYYQTFIDAVRATGGNNSSRVLVIQGPSTDIDKTYGWMNTMPVDSVSDRIMVEVHYYTPWNFCGLEKDESWGKMFYFWGQDYHSATNTSRNATWGEESDAEKLFQKMKTKFVDNGYPVLMGEYGVIKRIALTGEDSILHVASRNHFLNYITNSSVRHGLIPVYWDNGWTGNNGFGIVNRSDNSIYDQEALDAINEGYITSVESQNKTEVSSLIQYVNARQHRGSSLAEIKLYLNKDADVNISVYNILGQRVASFEDLNFSAGLHSINWNTGNLSTGVYLIGANIGRQLLTNKILIVH